MRLRAGRPSLVAATFDPAVVLPAGPVWIAHRARRGRAVVALLAEPEARVATGDGARWSDVEAAAGLGAAVRLRAPERADPEASARALLAASVGDAPVPLTAAGAVLIADLKALPGGFPAGPFTFSVHTTIGGPVTVAPLVLRYVPAN